MPGSGAPLPGLPGFGTFCPQAGQAGGILYTLFSQSYNIHIQENGKK